jgi:hypothetical protein
MFLYTFTHIDLMSLDSGISEKLKSAKDLDELAINIKFGTPWQKDQTLMKVEKLGEMKDFPVKSFVITYGDLFSILDVNESTLQQCLLNHNSPDFVPLIKNRVTHIDVGSGLMLPTVLLAPVIRYIALPSTASKFGFDEIHEGDEYIE